MASLLDSAKQALGLDSSSSNSSGPTQEQKEHFARVAEDATINPPSETAAPGDDDDSSPSYVPLLPYDSSHTSSHQRGQDSTNEQAGISATGNMTPVEVATYGAPGRGSAVSSSSSGGGDSGSDDVGLPEGGSDQAGISQQTRDTPVEIAVAGAPGRGSAKTA